MALLTSSRFGISYPSTDRSDRPDIPQHLVNIVTSLEANGAMYSQGTFANRPVSTVGTPGKQGRFYMSTDGVSGGSPGTYILWYDYGNGWAQITSTYAGPGTDSITSVELAPNSVTSVELADTSVDTAALQDGAVTTAKINNALKPSTGAGASTEALRALGMGAGQAMSSSNLPNLFASGPRSSLPANNAANNGLWYYATDQYAIYFGVGGVWVRIGAQPGDVIWTFETTARAGYIICTGQSWPGTTGIYADLYALWSSLYPSVLPDFQGREFVTKGTHADIVSLGLTEGTVLSGRRPRHKHSSTYAFAGTNANTGTESADHTHNVNGVTGTENQVHSHNLLLHYVGGAGGVGGVPTSTGSDIGTPGTDNESANHTHNLNINSGGRSAAHTHNYTPAGTVTGTVGPQTGSEVTDSQAYIVLQPQVKL